MIFFFAHHLPSSESITFFFFPASRPIIAFRYRIQVFYCPGRCCFFFSVLQPGSARIRFGSTEPILAPARCVKRIRGKVGRGGEQRAAGPARRPYQINGRPGKPTLAVVESNVKAALHSVRLATPPPPPPPPSAPLYAYNNIIIVILCSLSRIERQRTSR